MLAILKADARRIPLADESVQCVVTSPPYWGLRKYAGEQELVWGGRQDCEHGWGTERTRRQSGGWQGGADTGLEGGLPAGQASFPHKDRASYSDICVHCGAWRGAYGLEPTVEMYVQHTVLILREIRRVLRDDGVVFWNTGDSYAGSTTGNTKGGLAKLSERCDGRRRNEENWATVRGDMHAFVRPDACQNGLKPKDLCLIPFRVALAAQADGWWVRSDIIWAKPNPMPESVTDRPTRSHEYILLLTKSANYYWDAEAVKEPNESGPSDIKKMIESLPRIGGKHKNLDDPFSKASAATNIGQKRSVGNPNGRNLRSVWSFATEPYPEAHFATFPEELPKRCILAATSGKGSCEKCGAPWGRVVSKKPSTMNIRVRDAKKGTLESKTGFDQREKATEEEVDEYQKEELGYTETIGWRPGCECGIKRTVPCIVLDPFAGSGTVGKVAIELGRRAILCDLAYQDLASKRTAAIQRPLIAPDSAGWRE